MGRRTEEKLLEYGREAIAFAQKMLRIPSYSNQEGAVAVCIQEQMEKLGYDRVCMDRTGNVIGIVGCGDKKIQFDGHMDVVFAEDAAQWKEPPFSGAIIDGYLHGRGSVDMKGGLACAIYAAAYAKDMGRLNSKQILVTASVNEENCDGVNLKRLYEEHPEMKPDFFVICEPSGNLIALGHAGKAQLRIKTQGISAHGSAPEKGSNAIYKMAEILRRVEALNEKFAGRKIRASIAVTKISSVSASLNAIPSECEIYLDRRIFFGDCFARVREELDELVADIDATWEIGTLHETSWTGADLTYEPVADPWQTADDAPIQIAASAAYARTFGSAPKSYYFWLGGTNAVTPVAMGIPCIGFGPGDINLAHMRDERCRITQLEEAVRYYANLIDCI